MTAIEAKAEGGRESARDLYVWDPLVRVMHWSVALIVLINAFSDGEEVLHHWLGYIAVGLVALRIAWGLVARGPARLASFPPSPRRALRHLREILAGERRVHLGHNPLGALMVYNLWATIGVLGLTGYMMGTRAWFGVDLIEEIHEAAFNWIVVSVGLHIAGVLFDGWRTGVPLVRAMVTGRKRLPEEAEVDG